MKIIDPCNLVKPCDENKKGLTRRSLLRTATLASLVPHLCRTGRGQAQSIMAREVTEWIFVSCEAVPGSL